MKSTSTHDVFVGRWIARGGIGELTSLQVNTLTWSVIIESMSPETLVPQVFWSPIFKYGNSMLSMDDFEKPSRCRDFDFPSGYVCCPKLNEP